VAGTLKLPGLHNAVKVLRDRWSVPHIHAAGNHDLFMALGYVHAQDRLWQMELNRRTGHGRLAKVFGPVALDSDRFMRVPGFSRVVQQEHARLDDEIRMAWGMCGCWLRCSIAGHGLQAATWIAFVWAVSRVTQRSGQSISGLRIGRSAI
jgi:Protein related to penicillin acylase